MIDPRLSIIDKRLENIKRIIAVSGGKGGIGKSSIASILALCLSEKGHKVGLLDLDLNGPSTHIILGINNVCLSEDKGLIPPKIHGIKFMSIVHFTGNNPSPLRGNDISNVILEMLSVTLWGSLDFLIIDMPPGTGDTILDVIRLIKRMEFLLVTTQSKVAIEVVKKELIILKELAIPIIGVLENMRTRDNPASEKKVGVLGVPIIGFIDFDQRLEDALGDVNKLLNTDFARQLNRINLAVK